MGPEGDQPRTVARYAPSEDDPGGLLVLIPKSDGNENTTPSGFPAVIKDDVLELLAAPNQLFD